MKSMNKTVVLYLIIAIVSQCKTTTTETAATRSASSHDKFIFPQERVSNNSRDVATTTTARSNDNMIFLQEKIFDNSRAVTTATTTTTTTARSNDNFVFPQETAGENNTTATKTATTAGSNDNMIFPQERIFENSSGVKITKPNSAQSNDNFIFPQEKAAANSAAVTTTTDRSSDNFIFPQEKAPEHSTAVTTTITTSKLKETSNNFYNLFASDLFSTMIEGKSSQNIIYSPAAIQTCMALIFLGAEGETAAEMHNVLRFGGENDKLQIAATFGKFLKINPKTDNLTNDGPKLKIINRLYVKQQLKVAQEFTKLAREYFDTQAEQVNFNDSKNVIENVNEWVSQQTENKIKDLLKENTVTGDTNAILVNAIYFKANWLNAFSKSSTSKSNFYNNLNKSQQADLMYNIENYKYAELVELNATALEMPYNNSDISMLIILPNEIGGLHNLELQLKNKDLNEITSKMVMRKVHAHIPKFKIEFDVDLKDPLEKMGLVTTFSSKANFKSLFENSVFQGLTEVKHKAFLDINEAGSEAAAATFATLTNLSGIFDEPIFRADHPFVFAIRSKSVVYFTGHVVTI